MNKSNEANNKYQGKRSAGPVVHIKLIQILRAKEHTRVLYGRNTLSSPKLWLFDDSNASLNETDAAIAQKTTSSDQNDVILQLYIKFTEWFQRHGSRV